MPKHVNIGMSDELVTEEKPVLEVHCLEPVSLNEPLRSESHIRLLLFHPLESGSLADVPTAPLEDVALRCDVFQASLEDLKPTDKPAFAALSYRWGSPEKTKTVYCGKLEVKIHENLYHALTEALFHDRPRLVWTDGLCIDQDDAAEKSSQVARMSEVYRNAHVVIWLGYSLYPDADADVIECFNLFARVHAAFEENTTFDNVSEISDARLKRKAALEAKKAGLGRLEDLPWLQIRAFFTNAYFKRKWIVQEVNWAWSHEVHFDKWLIPLPCLVKSAEMVKRFEDIARPLLYDSIEDTSRLNDLMNDPENATFLFEGIAYEYEDRTPIILSQYTPRELVDTYSNRECSDPRDHIYAIASMFQLGSRSQGYPIDYSLNAVEVFTDFALDCFRTHNDLVLLGGCARQSFWRNPEAPATESGRSWIRGLPSWCPDWSGPWREARELVNTTRAESIVWCPAGDTLPSFTITPRTTLGLKGLSVGIILDCSVPWTLYHDDEADNRQELQSMQDFILKMLEIMPVAHLWRAYIDILLAPRERDAVDVIQELYPNSHEQRSYGDVLRDLGPAWLQMYAEKLYQRAAFPKNKRRTRKDLDMAVELLEIMCWRSRNTRLIVTNNGCIGTGPEGSQAGDEVCVLYGGKSLYVLRQHEDNTDYNFIGEAYVFGLMDGEAMDLDLSEQDFDLV